jgi:hypothetical protein
MLKLHVKMSENFTLISAHRKCSLTLIGFKEASLALMSVSENERFSLVMLDVNCCKNFRQLQNLIICKVIGKIVFFFIKKQGEKFATRIMPWQI